MALPGATTPNTTTQLAGTESRTKRPNQMILSPGGQDGSSFKPSLSIVPDAAAIEELPASQSQTQTQTEALTQMEMECTQQSQFDADETSNMTPTPLSPPPPLPWARLVPCVPTPSNGPVDLVIGKSEYCLGRSTNKCEIPIAVGASLSKKESLMMAWAHSMISNKHCRILNLNSGVGSGVTPPHQGRLSVNTEIASAPRGAPSQYTPATNQTKNYSPPETCSEPMSNGHATTNTISSTTSHPLPTPPSASPQPAQILLEDTSGNGTFVNHTTHLRKGHQRILHSGDEICLVNPETLRKKIKSGRILQAVLQQYTYILVVTSKPKRSPCVNPRAMNYRGVQNALSSRSGGVSSPRSARRIEAHYELREVLGDGTSGQVRRAIHRQTGQEYAVKVISLRQHLDLTSMEHEVSMMQSLDHPYIVQLVDVFVHHGIAMYLVMELVGGGDLFDRIVQKERYAEVDARRVMRRLLSAVYYLHETKNMVHRDLKPENILCASPTHVKLADFGLAKILQGDGLKTFCGTPQYFAPEVLQRRTTVAGSGRYGKPADLWSLGVILYILLTGRPPFGPDLDPMRAHEGLDFEDSLWNSMPQARELVQQMLRLDPKRRVTVKQACDHPWINTDDGDSHVHPLDDPAVTARKRLFSESNTELKSSQAVGDTDEGSSVTSKESIFSKEDFAAAATQRQHQRDRSLSFVKVSVLPEVSEQHEDDGTNGDRMESTSDAIESDRGSPLLGPRGMSVDQEGLGTNFSPESRDDDKETPVRLSNTTSPKGSSLPNINSTSPDGATTSVARELSVTPSDCGDEELLSRTPMTLNERSNRFRERVLRRPGGTNDSNSPPSPQPSIIDSSEGAVTPNASNVRAIVGQGNTALSNTFEAGSEELKDPILSQFSSEPSSLGSFPDSPAKGKALSQSVSIEGAKTAMNKDKDSQTNSTRKRPLSEDDPLSFSSVDAQESKHRQSSKQTRQTKLSTWFVPKKARVS